MCNFFLKNWFAALLLADLVVEVDEQEGRDDADDEEARPGRVEDGVVRMSSQVGHLHELPLRHDVHVARVLKEEAIPQRLAAESGSPGLVVMGDDSCLRGRRFESLRRTYTGWTFFCIDLS